MIFKMIHVIPISTKGVWCSLMFYMVLDVHEKYTGVTMTLLLSLNRMDRLPYHLDRWKGPMSIAVQMREDEINDLDRFLNIVHSLDRKQDIRFTFYIVKKRESGQYDCVFQSMENLDVHMEFCFVYNVLRDLAIETISTSHFMLLDGDSIISCRCLKVLKVLKD